MEPYDAQQMITGRRALGGLGDRAGQGPSGALCSRPICPRVSAGRAAGSGHAHAGEAGRAPGGARYPRPLRGSGAGLAGAGAGPAQPRRPRLRLGRGSGTGRRLRLFCFLPLCCVR